MRILVITSCTGQKTVESPRALTCEDFARGGDHVRMRESELGDLLAPTRVLGSIRSLPTPLAPNFQESPTSSCAQM